MKSFTDLYNQLDQTTRTSVRVAALKRYFDEEPPEDAVWALYFLSGRKLQRLVSSRLLREWVAERASLPLWLVEESYEAVGDLAEALALLLPDEQTPSDRPLHWWVQNRLLPLRDLPDDEKHLLLKQSWAELASDQKLIWHKLITGSFRVGVARGLIERALAEHAGLPKAIVAHRVMGPWEPTAESFLSLFSPEEDLANPGRPYPFFLASPLEAQPESLGDLTGWLIEWKWDGIRSQVIRRSGETLVWSRGEEMVTQTFPEIAALGDLLPENTVLDGEIVAWDSKQNLPASFNALQKRLGRKKVDAKLRAEAPVRLIAYDLLEYSAKDIRALTLAERRELLAEVCRELPPDLISLSIGLVVQNWSNLDLIRMSAREHAAEGLMLKRLDSAYGVGRQRGSWWKWKSSPFTMDAVMIYAQAGHGRRASLFTDYTFGVWSEGELVPVAKAYSGLTDAEIRRVDRFIRQNTLQRFGPVRTVLPTMVFELHFEGIQASTRHKSGIAVRFPRIARIRDDKPAEEADSLDMLKKLAATGGV